MRALEPSSIRRLARTPTVAIALISTALLSSSAAKAQSVPWFSYRPVPLGGRTATMGGAGVAFGADSAMPFLNPSGLAQVDRHRISMSATAYGAHAVRADGYFTTGEPDPLFAQYADGVVDRHDSQSFTAFPTSFVYSWPFGAETGKPGHQVVSLSILTPRQYTMQWRSQFGVDFAGSQHTVLRALDSSLSEYYFGPSYALQATPALRVGASAFVVYDRFTETSTLGLRHYVGTEYSNTDEFKSVSAASYSFVPALGLQVNPWGGLHFGATVHFRSMAVHGSYERTAVSEDANSLGNILDGEATSALVDTSGRIKTNTFQITSPTSVFVGTGYEKPGVWAVALDLQFYAPVSYRELAGTYRTATYSAEAGSSVESTELARRVKGNTVINLSIGGELFITRNIAARAGFFTDNSPTPELTVVRDQSHFDDRAIDMLGGSLGLGLYAGPVDFTMGVVYEGGKGKMGGFLDMLNPTSGYQPVDGTESRLTAIITGGVSFGEAFAPISKHLSSFETPEDVLKKPGALLPGVGGPAAPTIPEPLPPSPAPSPADAPPTPTLPSSAPMESPPTAPGAAPAAPAPPPPVPATGAPAPAALPGPNLPTP